VKTRAWVLAFLVLAGCETTQTVRRPDGSTVQLPKCTPVIQYQARSFTVRGFSVPIPQVGTTVQIGEVTWDAHTLQAAATVSQIMDLERVSSCEHLVVLASTVTDKDVYEAALLDIFDKESKLSQLALLIQANDPTAVQRWVEAYAFRPPVKREPADAVGTLKTAQGGLKPVAVVPLEQLIQR